MEPIPILSLAHIYTLYFGLYISTIYLLKKFNNNQSTYLYLSINL